MGTPIIAPNSTSSFASSAATAQETATASPSSQMLANVTTVNGYTGPAVVLNAHDVGTLTTQEIATEIITIVTNTTGKNLVDAFNKPLT